VGRAHRTDPAGHRDHAAVGPPPDRDGDIGPPDRVRGRLAAWEDSIVTTLLIPGPPETLRTAAEIVLG